MKTMERVKVAYTVEKDWKLYSYRETVVSEMEEISSQYDIDYVLDKLNDGFYPRARQHWLELQKKIERYHRSNNKQKQN